MSVRDRLSISGVVCLNNTYSTRYYASLKNKCMFSLIAVAKVVTGTILMVVVEGYPLCTCTTCVYVRLCFEMPVIHSCIMHDGEGGGGGLPIMYMHHVCMSDSVLRYTSMHV